MAKYTHYITVPTTTSVNVIVESDEDTPPVQKSSGTQKGVKKKVKKKVRTKNEK